MTTSAIQMDVQTNDNNANTTTTGVTTDAQVDAATDASTERPLSPRELAMAEISASRLQAFEKETGLKVADAPVEPANVAENLDTGTDTQLAAQLDDKPTVLTDGFDRVKVPIKVDGEESEATVEDMRREYQKGKTADKRLAEVARRQKELDEREAQLNAQGVTTSTQAAPVDIDPSITKDFTSAVLQGDEETAAKAFAAAVSKAVQTQVATLERGNTIPDVQAITQTVKQQLVVESALEQSRKDYPQLYADPDIEALGATKIQRAMSDEGMSFTDALQSVSKEFATKFGWQAAGRQEQTAPTTAHNAKLERKAGIDNIPAANVKSSTTEAPPVTTTDVINQMKAARGQV